MFRSAQYLLAQLATSETLLKTTPSPLLGSPFAAQQHMPYQNSHFAFDSFFACPINLRTGSLMLASKNS